MVFLSVSPPRPRSRSGSPSANTAGTPAAPCLTSSWAMSIISAFSARTSVGSVTHLVSPRTRPRSSRQVSRPPSVGSALPSGWGSALTPPPPWALSWWPWDGGGAVWGPSRWVTLQVHLPSPRSHLQTVSVQGARLPNASQVPDASTRPCGCGWLLCSSQLCRQRPPKGAARACSGVCACAHACVTLQDCLHQEKRSHTSSSFLNS